MSTIIYTAERKLAAGHIAGQSYYLDFTVSQLDDESREISKTTLSMGGSSQSIIERIEERSVITTTFIHYNDIGAWREFQFSVAGRAAIILDELNEATYQTPSNQRAASIESMPKINRVSADYFTVSFTAIYG